MTATCWSTTCSTTRAITTCGTRMSTPTCTTTRRLAGGPRPERVLLDLDLSRRPTRMCGERRRSARPTTTRPAGRKAACPRSTSTRAQYLDANPDVAAAHIDPLSHFLGSRRGRGPPADRADRAHRRQRLRLRLLPGQQSRTSRPRGVDPFRHFQTIGWKEGRDPNALFDTSGYLATYTDVAAADINPLDHYTSFGLA